MPEDPQTWPGAVPQWLRTLPALPEGQSLVSSTCIKLPTTCNSSFRGSIVLFWAPWAPAVRHANEHMHTCITPPHLTPTHLHRTAEYWPRKANQAQAQHWGRDSALPVRTYCPHWWRQFHWPARKLLQPKCPWLCCPAPHGAVFFRVHLSFRAGSPLRLLHLPKPIATICWPLCSPGS